MAMFISSLGQVIIGLAFAFWKGWKLTLVMLAVTPLLGIFGAVFQRLIASRTAKGLKLEVKVNEVASETLSGIKTVYSFVGEALLSQKHSQLLKRTIDNNICKAHFQALSLAFIFFIIYGIYAFGFLLWWSFNS